MDKLNKLDRPKLISHTAQFTRIIFTSYLMSDNDRLSNRELANTLYEIGEKKKHHSFMILWNIAQTNRNDIFSLLSIIVSTQFQNPNQCQIACNDYDIKARTVQVVEIKPKRFRTDDKDAFLLCTGCALA